MKEFDVQVTAQVEDVLKISLFHKHIQFLLKIYGKIFERYTGERPVMPVSQSLQLFGENSIKLWGIIDTIYTLQSLGIIQHFSKNKSYPDEPRSFGYTATPRAGGRDFLSEERAAWKAIAESTERYIWRRNDFFSKYKIVSSFKEVKNRALDIFSLAGFAEEQKKRRPELQFTENIPLGWIPARSLVKGKKILCPIQLVSSYYCRQYVKTPQNKSGVEPMLRWCVTTGLANGQTLEDAIVAGVLEVIERDAFMITYLNKLSPPLIDLEYLAEQDEDISNILKKIKRYNLEVYMIALPTDFPVHVILSLIIDRSGKGPAASVGASADFDFKTCFLDALSEALSVRYSLKTRYKNPINVMRMGREERLIYYAQQENAKKLNFLTLGKKIRIDLKENIYFQNTKFRHDREQLGILVDEFKKKKYELCFVEISSKETKKLGFRTVFVVAPELQPMHLDEEIPYFGGKRLKEVPEKLGYEVAKKLNKEPHPFP